MAIDPGALRDPLSVLPVPRSLCEAFRLATRLILHEMSQMTKHCRCRQRDPEGSLMIPVCLCNPGGLLLLHEVRMPKIKNIEKQTQSHGKKRNQPCEEARKIWQVGIWKRHVFQQNWSLEDCLHWLNVPNKAGINRAMHDLYHSGPLQHSIARKLCREIRASSPQPINIVKPC